MLYIILCVYTWTYTLNTSYLRSLGGPGRPSFLGGRPPPPEAGGRANMYMHTQDKTFIKGYLKTILN